MTRDPKDLLIRAQVYLMCLRKPLRPAEQKEWDELTDAINLLEKCLKEIT
jgi:hypothetical protein